MPSTILLSPATSSLRTLTLSRLQLDQDAPVCQVQTTGDELLFYSLIGAVELCDPMSNDMESWGLLGTRRKVTEPGVHIMRFPAGHPLAVDVCLRDFSADLLLVSVPGPASTMPPLGQSGGSIWAHQVGDGTHQREVREVLQPPGYAICCGETFQMPGMISSWPPHANAEDLTKFRAGVTTWDEVFFCVCPSPGIAVLAGYYMKDMPVDEVIRLENGHAYQMPLGSHMCYAAPDSYLWYVWFYCGDALQKQYRKYADDVGVYRK